MESNEINYDEVLRDLQLRRDAIERAIDSISKLISGHGFGYSTKKFSKQELEDMYHGEGLSCQEIAEKTGKSASGVRIQIKKNGIEMRERGTAGRMKKAATVTQSRIEEPVEDPAERPKRRPFTPDTSMFKGPPVKSLKDMSPAEQKRMQALYGVKS